jgi:hypothetical protein
MWNKNFFQANKTWDNLKGIIQAERKWRITKMQKGMKQPQGKEKYVDK